MLPPVSKMFLQKKIKVVEQSGLGEKKCQFTCKAKVAPLDHRQKHFPQQLQQGPSGQFNQYSSKSSQTHLLDPDVRGPEENFWHHEPLIIHSHLTLHCMKIDNMLLLWLFHEDLQDNVENSLMLSNYQLLPISGLPT